jgi:hypothetical protein
LNGRLPKVLVQESQYSPWNLTLFFLFLEQVSITLRIDFSQATFEYRIKVLTKNHATVIKPSPPLAAITPISAHCHQLLATVPSMNGRISIVFTMMDSLQSHQIMSNGK